MSTFGISDGKDQFITTPWGVMEFMPTAFTVEWDQIRMEGIVTSRDKAAERIKRLSDYSVIELMHEVNERIRTGQNADEKRG